ncbi:hypothetical protein GQ44DRAFT_198747 [Phaeosphaeriaceae sp. PMI808]|nr:hypothetical protein GQ44DRAFT_198747 [Phaeosphaeriaceae sp. PMI808]
MRFVTIISALAVTAIAAPMASSSSLENTAVAFDARAEELKCKNPDLYLKCTRGCKGIPLLACTVTCSIRYCQ